MTDTFPGRLPSPAFWSGKRVLVTGHTGFKGSWLTAWLTQLGASVAGLSLPEPPTSPSLWDRLELDVVHDIRTDVCGDDWQGEAAEFAPEVVIHLAAQPLVSEGYASPLETFRTNVLGTAKVLAAASGLDSLEVILVATTDKVYDTERPAPYSESSALGGVDPYAASKAGAELVVRSWPGMSAPAATGRAGNVIGGGDWGDNRLVPDLIRGWTSNAVPQLRRPDAVRPWQHVLEPLSGYLVYVEQLAADPTVPRSMNFGPAAHQNVAVREVAEHAAETWGAVLELSEPPQFTVTTSTDMHETGFLGIDSTLAADRLAWRSALDWRTAVDWAIDWYAADANGGDVASLLNQQIRTYTTRASS